MIPSHPNPDLALGEDARPRWNSAPYRRHGFHNLHRLSRYVQSCRAGRVSTLRPVTDYAIAARDDVARFCALPFFSAMVVAEEGRILFERYAPDFGPDQPHSIMSISKTVMNLVIGRLRDEGRLRLDETAEEILPWIGPGYAGATLQQILDMNVLNDYDEDYLNPDAAVFQHEAACGMRLPTGAEPSTRDVLAGIGLAPGAKDTTNPTGLCMYRSANTDVLAAVAEARGGRPMAAWLADLADAAGFEAALYAAGDRGGFPMMNGGICLTARDLARHGLLIARQGRGIDGTAFGSAAFLEETLHGGIPMPAPRGHLRYANQFNTNGLWLGHGGYGGQYMLVNMTTGRVGVFLSVLDTEHGYEAGYYPPIIALLEALCAG